VADVRTRLERGEQITVAIPACVDSYTFEECVRAITPSLAFASFQAADLQLGTPAEALARALFVDVPRGTVPDEQLLAAATETAGFVTWIHAIGGDPAVARDWGDFVSLYTRAVRRQGSDSPAMRIIVCLAGAVPATMARDEPGWSTAWYWGRVGRLDVGAYLQTLEPELEPVRRSQIVELAGFDFDLAEILLETRSTEPGDLVAVIREAGHPVCDFRSGSDRRIWCRADTPADLHADWADGVVDRFDGDDRAFWHSRLFTEPDDEHVLRRRLWSGQVRSFLPALEEWRVLVIEQAKREGFIAGGIHVDHFDFGALHDHLATGGQSSRRRALREFAGWLRRSRNRIAHLDLVSEAQRREGEHLAAAALRGL
jgi:hypothetical protein